MAALSHVHAHTHTSRETVPAKPPPLSRRRCCAHGVSVLCGARAMPVPNRQKMGRENPVGPRRGAHAAQSTRCDVQAHRPSPHPSVGYHTRRSVTRHLVGKFAHAQGSRGRSPRIALGRRPQRQARLAGGAPCQAYWCCTAPASPAAADQLGLRVCRRRRSGAAMLTAYRRASRTTGCCWGGHRHA